MTNLEARSLLDSLKTNIRLFNKQERSTIYEYDEIIENGLQLLPSEQQELSDFSERI